MLGRKRAGPSLRGVDSRDAGDNALKDDVASLLEIRDSRGAFGV